MKKSNMCLKPIGVVHSPYKTTDDAPFQGGEKQVIIEVFHEYEEGLKDVETFSHLHILYWLHKARKFLQPCGSNSMGFNASWAFCCTLPT